MQTVFNAQHLTYYHIDKPFPVLRNTVIIFFCGSYSTFILELFLRHFFLLKKNISIVTQESKLML